jgi:putative transcriptional regulator
MTIDLQESDLDAVTAISEFAIGALSPARHAIIACQREICADVQAEIEFQEHIAASVMVRDQNEALSPDFFDRFSSRLDALDDTDCTVDDIKTIGSYPMPKYQQIISGTSLSEIKWSHLVPGVSISNIIGNRGVKKGERLYFLKAKGGMKLPDHSHNGEEWTLILSGAYKVGETHYKRGDLHISNDNDEHAPHIEPGDDCICLVMTEGPLKLQGLLPRLLQPVIGL